MNSASTHIYRLTSIRSVSIRSYKAERLHFILEKIWKTQEKTKTNKNWLFLPPELLAGCGDPVLSMSLKRSPQHSAPEGESGSLHWGWWVVCESGGQDRSQLKRGGGWSTNPQTSPLHQSPKTMLMEVSTEDGADISGKPKCIQHRQQV